MTCNPELTQRVIDAVTALLTEESDAEVYSKSCVVAIEIRKTKPHLDRIEALKEAVFMVQTCCKACKSVEADLIEHGVKL
jgi:hypothetical protein